MIIHSPMLFYNGIINQDWTLDELVYPVIVSPKYDGVFVMKDEGKIWTRGRSRGGVKEITQPYAQQLGSQLLENGMNAELLIKGESFHHISGWCNRKVNTPADVQFMVFDWLVATGRYESYHVRQDRLKFHKFRSPLAVCVTNIECRCREQVLEQHRHAIAIGCEGIIIRNPRSQYKFGRTTKCEGDAFKMISVVTKVGMLIGTTPNTVKSTSIGAMIVSTPEFGNIKLGSGFDEETGKALFYSFQSYNGRKVYYQYRPHGMQAMPRQPIFGGWV